MDYLLSGQRSYCGARQRLGEDKGFLGEQRSAYEWLEIVSKIWKTKETDCWMSGQESVPLNPNFLNRTNKIMNFIVYEEVVKCTVWNKDATIQLK